MTGAVDRIRITGIEGVGHHGVLPEERRDGQVFRADVELVLDLTSAAATDDLAHTVDYGVVAQAVHAVLVGEPQDLVESVAARCLDAAMADGRVRMATVTIHKPEAPVGVPFDGVSVTMTRARG